MSLPAKPDDRIPVVFGATTEEIAKMLGPAPISEANQCLSALFVGLKSRRLSDYEEKILAEQFNEALFGYPQFAIEEAVNRFVQHKVQRDKRDMNFVPQPGELGTEVKRCMLERVRFVSPIEGANENSSNGLVPYQKRQAEIKEQFRRRPVLGENVSLETFHQSVKNYPTGSTWCHGVVYGPDPANLPSINETQTEKEK